MNQYPMQGVASLVAAQGRGGDSTLVHMTPDEVRSLQALARSRGMELPINPETGYPEANFLSNFLRSIGRGISTVATTALQNPLTTSLITGAAYGAIKGDLQKGLDAGMKAYAGTRILGGITSAMGQGVGKTTATKSPTPDELARMSDEDVLTNTVYGGLPAAAIGKPQTTVRSPSGIENALRNILGGGQSGTAQQGQQRQGGLFRSGDPIWDAIMM